MEPAQVGDVVGPVEVDRVAHGGHCVARLDGRVVFVRHTLPGEVVMVRLTDVSKARLWRGDAVEVIVAGRDRVLPRCDVARPGGCGGCDWQHVGLAAQRELKRAVVAEQFRRLAGLEWDGVVEPPGPAGVGRWGHASVTDDDGYGWRTRMRYVVAGHSRDREPLLGMRAHRSHAVVRLPAEGCAISATPPPSLPPESWEDADAGEVVVAGVDGDVSVVVGGKVVAGPRLRTEHAAGRRWTVAADDFWQVHPAAADTLVAAVLAGLDPRPGERALDLYCGVGLFAGALAGRGVAVHGVESWGRAVDLARANVPEATFAAAAVDRYLSRHRARTDLVVLDPPRTGAGAAVVAGVARLRPRAIAYVACDPASLARDLATFASHGYGRADIRAFDLFPMTHHVECVAVLQAD